MSARQRNPLLKSGSMSDLGLKSALVFISISFAFLAGCSNKNQVVSLAPPAHSFEPDDYKPVLRTWTRSRRLNTLEEMDNVLTVTSTYYSAEFRAAYLAKYEEDFHLQKSERRALAEQHRSLNETQHEFYVALYAQTQKYGLLGEEESAWKVQLVDDRGTVVEPLRIERIVRPGVVERTYFPYTTSFRTVFRVIFDKAASGGAVTQSSKWFGLRFFGPQGTTVLKWHLS